MTTNRMERHRQTTMPIPFAPSYKTDAELWPSLQFWFGLRVDDLIELPRNIIGLYVKNLAQLQAEYQLLHIQAATYPHMQDRDRRKFMNTLQQDLIGDDGKPKTPEQFAQTLQNVGVAFEIVPKEAGE